MVLGMMRRRIQLTDREWQWLWEYTRTGSNASEAARIVYGGTSLSVRVKGHKKKVKPFLDRIEKIWDQFLGKKPNGQLFIAKGKPPLGRFIQFLPQQIIIVQKGNHLSQERDFETRDGIPGRPSCGVPNRQFLGKMSTRQTPIQASGFLNAAVAFDQIKRHFQQSLGQSYPSLL
jgi:hypothetical protein